MKGKELIVIMGKSGSGKDSLVKEILKCSKTLKALIPYTTRPMRPNEENGKDYFFVSPESFEEHVKSNDFAAMTEYHTVQGIWKYGIPKIEKPGIIPVFCPLPGQCFPAPSTGPGPANSGPPAPGTAAACPAP